MTTFVDTSALYAAVDGNDQHHDRAWNWLARARDEGESLVTHNYVVVEAAALVRSRIGPGAVTALFDSLLVPIRVVFVEAALHRSAVASHLARPTRPSLVDHVSFRVMRDRGIVRAFVFDKDFVREGFEVVP